MSDPDATQRTSVPAMLEHQSPEDAIIHGRRERAAHVRSKGEDPFANQVGEFAQVGKVLAGFADTKTAEGKYDPAKVTAKASGPVRCKSRRTSVSVFNGARIARWSLIAWVTRACSSLEKR